VPGSVANHESPRTTTLYDRTSDAISLDEIERILIRYFDLVQVLGADRRAAFVIRHLERIIAKESMQTERSHTMGDKGGKKDKNKTQKQKAAKQEQQTQKKQDKQPKSTP